jgi:hypothetical protein
LLAPAPGSRGYVWAIIAAQMLAQIGAFPLSALLPGYMGSLHDFLKTAR